MRVKGRKKNVEMRRGRNKREEGGNRKGNWKKRSYYKKKNHAVDFSKMGELL